MPMMSEAPCGPIRFPANGFGDLVSDTDRPRQSAGAALDGRAGRRDPPVRAAGREHPRPGRVHGSGAARQSGLLDPPLHQPSDRTTAGLSVRGVADGRRAVARRSAPGRPGTDGGGRRERAPHAVVPLRRIPDGAPGRSHRVGQREGERRQGRDRRRAVLAGRHGRHHRSQARRVGARDERAPVPLDLRRSRHRRHDDLARRADPRGEPDARADLRVPVRGAARPAALSTTSSPPTARVSSASTSSPRVSATAATSSISSAGTTAR